GDGYSTFKVSTTTSAAIVSVGTWMINLGSSILHFCTWKQDFLRIGGSFTIPRLFIPIPIESKVLFIFILVPRYHTTGPYPSEYSLMSLNPLSTGFDPPRLRGMACGVAVHELGPTFVQSLRTSASGRVTRTLMVYEAEGLHEINCADD
ncbi:hypothetical protein EV702DRAFT_926154, partial [Suillus placidus]